MTNKYNMQVTSDGVTFKIKVKDGNVKVKSSDGYCIPQESLLLSLKDNGNGYYVKAKSHNSVNPDHIFNLDYSEIEYIYFAYKALMNSKVQK